MAKKQNRKDSTEEGKKQDEACHRYVDAVRKANPGNR
jgi:hypothetical protein